jgi:tRNA G10  N-methylase Trm11
MSYAESHLLNLKKSPEIHTVPSVKSSSNYVTENPFRKPPLLAEELTTVPIALARKYLYLSERYAFADRDQMMGTEMYRPDATSPQVWAPILARAKVNVSMLQVSATSMPFALIMLNIIHYLKQRGRK